MNAVKDTSNPYRVNNVPLHFVSFQDAVEEKLKVSLFPQGPVLGGLKRSLGRMEINFPCLSGLRVVTVAVRSSKGLFHQKISMKAAQHTKARVDTSKVDIGRLDPKRPKDCTTK
jgi:hypothetical protein